MMEAVETRYETTPKATFEDPAFYVGDAGTHELVATVSYSDREIRVFRDGEMRLHLWGDKESRERGDAVTVIICSDNLTNTGIGNDAELAKAEEDGRLEWLNNAWFDLYAYGAGIGDGWLNHVEFRLSSAIRSAEQLIIDDRFWGNIR